MGGRGFLYLTLPTFEKKSCVKTDGSTLVLFLERKSDQTVKIIIRSLFKTKHSFKIKIMIMKDQTNLVLELPDPQQSHNLYLQLNSFHTPCDRLAA